MAQILYRRLGADVKLLYHVVFGEGTARVRELELTVGLCLCSDLLSLDQSKTFYKPDWFDIVGAEVKCCKEAVCVIDMSSFTKFELTVSRLLMNSQRALLKHSTKESQKQPE